MRDVSLSLTTTSSGLVYLGDAILKHHQESLTRHKYHLSHTSKSLTFKEPVPLHSGQLLSCRRKNISQHERLQ